MYDVNSEDNGGIIKGYKATLHNHSVNSHPAFCKGATIERIVDYAMKKGIAVLAITDDNKDVCIDQLKAKSGRKDSKYTLLNDLDDRAIILESKDGSYKHLILLRGVEFHKEQGHIAAVGYKGGIEVPDNYDLKDSIKYMRDKGAIIFPTHIMHSQVGGLPRESILAVRDEIDAVETFNSQRICFIPGIMNASKHNKPAMAFALEEGIPQLYGADAHRFYDIDLSYQIFASLNTSSGEALVEGMRSDINKRNYKNHGELNSWLRFTRWAVLPRFTNKDALRDGFKLAGRILTGRNKDMEKEVAKITSGENYNPLQNSQKNVDDLISEQEGDEEDSTKDNN